MHVRNNYDLKSKNTFRLTSICKTIYFPEAIRDLLSISEQCKDSGYHILGNGSNILLNKFIEIPVVSMERLNRSLSIDENGIITCGCSVKIQELIQYAKFKGYGGIEFLYSIPATIGGIVCMNAGRAMDKEQSISKYVTSVRYFDGKRLVTLKKDECEFKQRSSIFKEKQLMIYDVQLELSKKINLKIEEDIQKRMEFSKNYLDMSNANAGSIFSTASPKVLKIMKGLRFGNAKFSPKTLNWILNLGNASYKDIKSLIVIAVFFHKLLFKKIEMEIIDWER